MKTCPSCGTSFNDEYMFCPKCGAKVETNPKLCSKCGNEYHKESMKFCPHCGEPNEMFGGSVASAQPQQPNLQNNVNHVNPTVQSTNDFKTKADSYRPINTNKESYINTPLSSGFEERAPAEHNLAVGSSASVGSFKSHPMTMGACIVFMVLCVFGIGAIFIPFLYLDAVLTKVTLSMFDMIKVLFGGQNMFVSALDSEIFSIIVMVMGGISLLLTVLLVYEIIKGIMFICKPEKYKSKKKFDFMIRAMLMRMIFMIFFMIFSIAYVIYLNKINGSDTGVSFIGSIVLFVVYLAGYITCRILRTKAKNQAINKGNPNLNN